jgi:hypothetical protein
MAASCYNTLALVFALHTQNWHLQLKNERLRLLDLQSVIEDMVSIKEGQCDDKKCNPD